VDTVGYRTRDLVDFRAVLAADAGVLKPNGNNVDLEIEMAKMVRNSALHSTAAALLAQQFTLLREAISGQLHS
jgi:flagellar basal body rod protein FlgB